MVDITRVAVAVDSRQIKTARMELAGMQREGQRAESSMSGLARSVASIASGVSLAVTLRQVVSYTDAWQNASNQLRQVTSSTMQLSQVQDQLLAVSNETRSGFESTANLYAHLARSTTELGLAQSDLLQLTKTINQAFIASGATAQEADAAITQLSQGLAAGALRGDEFNSVSEQAPMLMRAIADSLNMTIGELREFASEGGITAEIVVNALRLASGEIEDNFSKAVLTFGQAMTVARNNILDFIGGAEGIQDLVSGASRLVILLSENIAQTAKAIATLALAMSLPAITRFAGTITASAGAMLSLERATVLATSALRTLGRVAVAGLIVEGIVAAYEKLQEFSDFVENSPATWGTAGRLAVDQFVNAIINGLFALGNGMYNAIRVVTDPIAASFEALGNSLPDLLFGNITAEDVWSNVTVNAEAAFNRAFTRVGADFQQDMSRRLVQIASEADIALWANRNAQTTYTPEAANDNIRELNRLTKEQLELRKELADDLEREMDSWRELDELVGGLQRERQQVGMLAVEIEKLETIRRAENIAKKAGIPLSDEMREKIEQEIEARHALQEEYENEQRQLEELRRVGERAFDGMADALADFAMTGKLDFSSLTNSIIKDMIRIQIQQMALVATGTSSGSGFFGALASGFMSLFGGGVSAATGYGQLASSAPAGMTNLSGMANGGNPQPGSITEVNERGPEMLSVGNRQFLMMGNQSGKVTPNHMLGGAANVNIQIVNNGTPQEVTSQQQTQTADGGIDIRMIVDDVSSRNTADRASKTNAAFRNTFGAKERLVGR